MTIQLTEIGVLLDSVEELAKKKQLTMAQIALAWSLSKDGISAPIVGTTSLTNLKDLIGMYCCSCILRRPGHWCRADLRAEAVNIKLSPEEIKYLEEPYKPTGVAGHQ